MTRMICRVTTIPAILCLVMSVATTSVVFAQTHAGQPENVLEPTKIYSPYVERTTADSNLAEVMITTVKKLLTNLSHLAKDKKAWLALVFGAYVISMARTASDVLAVHLLLQEAGCPYR